MSLSHLPEYICFLLHKSSYPHESEEVELLQTHISFVTLAGNYVYKWKKPVIFGFLDFSSLEKRKFFCDEELRLNRRLCPEIYLETVSVNEEGGHFSLGGPGEVIEYGVKMVRLPQACMMDRIIAAGKLQKEHIKKIVEILVPFYASAQLDGRNPDYGSSEAMGRTVHDNFSETRRFVGGEALSAGRFTIIQEFADDFLGRKELFIRRRESGCTRECHGDLHSGNICLDEHVHIFDCIEFNERLRCTDIAADIAFLAMDLEFHDLPDLSDFFIKYFVEFSGDEGLPEMLNFYKCYRAYVRGKIGLLTSADPTVGEDIAAMALRNAGRYFQLAEKYAQE